MILHLDMDAFYASVEQIDTPRLKGKPVLVGGLGPRAVVAAASYEARKFGVHSAMPMYQARKKCPIAVVVAPRKHRYSQVSKQIMDIMRQFSPLLEQVSIDEAFMDLQGCGTLFGSPKSVAMKMKRIIWDKFSLTCSVGLAPNKFLAKIASDMNKPNGLVIITPDRILSVIAELPIKNVPGVGKSVLKKLEPLGVSTLGDVSRIPENVLFQKLGSFGRRLLELSFGKDSSPVLVHSPAKSFSSEHTLSQDTMDMNQIRRYLLAQAEAVAKQLRQYQTKARTVTLKLKFSDFKVITRRTTRKKPIVSASDIYDQASKLLCSLTIRKKIRLVGVGVSGFMSKDPPVQISLFDPMTTHGDGWEKIDHTIDKIEKKFGEGSVSRAALTDNKVKS